MINKNQFNAVTMPELRAEVVRLSSIVDYYRAENNQITNQTGRLVVALLENAIDQITGDLNSCDCMSDTTATLLNDYHDHLTAAYGEILSLTQTAEL
tara:strand:+ start:6202 stop:6492 length:291 start_codon:yes stop_codon:yes gene_type:complete